MKKYGLKSTYKKSNKNNNLTNHKRATHMKTIKITPSYTKVYGHPINIKYLQQVTEDENIIGKYKEISEHIFRGKRLPKKLQKYMETEEYTNIQEKCRATSGEHEESIKLAIALRSNQRRNSQRGPTNRCRSYTS